MITYEWILEFLDDSDLQDDDPDIIDTHAWDSYKEALEASRVWDTTTMFRIGLTRNEWTESDGLKDRMWSYVNLKTNQLSAEFDYGEGFPTGRNVPKRFQEEINKVQRERGNIREYPV